MSAIRSEQKVSPLVQLEEDVAIPREVPREPDDVQPLSVLALANVVLRHRAIAFGLPLIVAIWMLITWANGVLWPKVGPETYTAITTFDVEGGTSSQTQVTGLAAQLGLVAAGPAAPPYERIIKSRALLLPVTRIQFTVHTANGWRRGTIGQLYRVRGKTPAHRLERSLNQIRGMVRAGADNDGTPALMVTSLWPSLSIELADTLVNRLNQFNTQRQRTRVGREKQFTVARLEEKAQELRVAELRMQNFLLANRNYQSSPTLVFEFDRLNRNLGLKQSLYNQFASAVETARIDEVRNAPILSVIENAYVPPKFEEERKIPLPTKEIVRVILALIVGVFFAFVVEFFQRSRMQNVGDMATFNLLKQQTLADLRRPWQLFGLRRRSRP